MQEDIPFDREKFKDAVHYIVQCVNDRYSPDALGNTKLHKILYYADMSAYLEHFAPMTGEHYLRQKCGPTARHLTETLGELAKEGRISVAYSNFFGFQKSDYTSRVRLRSNRLAATEMAALDHMIGFVCAKTASEISEFSYDEVWKWVPMGQRIPYFAVLAWPPSELTEEEVRQFELEAVRIAPVIAAERRDGGLL